MTSEFSWQKFVSLFPVSFCTPKAKPACYPRYLLTSCFCPLGWLEGAGRDGGGERGARQEQCWHAARSWSRELRREEGRGEDQGGEERESERCRKCAHGGVPTLLLLPVPEPT